MSSTRKECVLCFAASGTVLKNITSIAPGSVLKTTQGGMTTILSSGNIIKKITQGQPSLATPGNHIGQLFDLTRTVYLCLCHMALLFQTIIVASCFKMYNC